MGIQWGDEDEDARLRRVNLEAVPAGAGGGGGYVEEDPDAPWWQDAEEMTMTVVRGVDVPAVADVLGLDLGAMAPMFLVDAPWEDGASPLALVAVPGAVAVAEPNGWTTVQPGTVAALSRLGRTVSLYWNVNLVARFVVADAGRVVRDFDPVVDGGGGTGPPLPEEDGADWEGDSIATAAALQARVTGVHLTRGQVFGAPLRTAMVPWPR